jgi:hypothetical protein
MGTFEKNSPGQVHSIIREEINQVYGIAGIFDNEKALVLLLNVLVALPLTYDLALQKIIVEVVDIEPASVKTIVNLAIEKQRIDIVTLFRDEVRFRDSVVEALEQSLSVLLFPCFAFIPQGSFDQGWCTVRVVVTWGFAQMVSYLANVQ